MYYVLHTECPFSEVPLIHNNIIIMCMHAMYMWIQRVHVLPTLLSNCFLHRPRVTELLLELLGKWTRSEEVSRKIINK